MNAFNEELARLLGVPLKQLTTEYRVAEQQVWDSFMVMYVVGLVDKYFKKQLDSKQLLACQTYGDLMELIKECDVVKN